MPWNDDSWKDGYDAWKLASPDEYDRESLCDHEYYEVDIVTGRASCNDCLAHWYVSEEKIQRQIEHEVAYHKQMERDNRRQWWRDLWQRIQSITSRRRRASVNDDDIPF